MMGVEDCVSLAQMTVLEHELEIWFIFVSLLQASQPSRGSNQDMEDCITPVRDAVEDLVFDIFLFSFVSLIAG
jgi:hypothetical protein